MVSGEVGRILREMFILDCKNFQYPADQGCARLVSLGSPGGVPLRGPHDLTVVGVDKDSANVAVSLLPHLLRGDR